MNPCLLPIASVLLAAAVLSPAARAADPRWASTARATNEYERNMNYPTPVHGTRESRRAERREIRTELRDPQTRASILAEDDEWSLNDNELRPVTGTHASRQAEREARRAQMRDLVRSGRMPVSDEADVMRLPR
jgi:hypothetical protein